MSSGRLEIDAGEVLVQVVLPDHNVCANQINGESSTMIQVACQNILQPLLLMVTSDMIGNHVATCQQVFRLEVESVMSATKEIM